MKPAALEMILSRMTAHELCEALVLVRRCVRIGLIDTSRAEQLAQMILSQLSLGGPGRSVPV